MNNYDRAKKWFYLGFGTSVNSFNAESDPEYRDDEDLLELFHEKWLEEPHPKWYKEEFKKIMLQEVK